MPHGALGIHGAIEFGNRLMTFVLAAVAIATWLATTRVWPKRAPGRRLAGVLALGIPGQAILGGITVLTDLNPWIVGLHMMLSMLLIAAAVLLVYQTRAPVAPVASPWARRLAAAIALVAYAVMHLGTVVTGSGPHAGDAEAPRIALDPQLLSHVHAWVVYLLVALTLAMLVVLRRAAASGRARNAAWLLLVVQIAQGALGFWQYHLDLPAVLVGLHLLGAALVAAAVTHLAVEVYGSRVTRPG